MSSFFHSSISHFLHSPPPLLSTFNRAHPDARNANASARVVVPLPALGNTAFTVVPGLTVEQFLADLRREDKALSDARLFTEEGTSLAGTTFLRQVGLCQRRVVTLKGPRKFRAPKATTIFTTHPSRPHASIPPVQPGRGSPYAAPPQ